MKVLHIFSVLLVLVLMSGLALSIEAENGVEDVLKDIMERQGARNASEIDCAKVSSGDFDELGDAVMERMIGNRELHEQMDKMMGGEGSESLAQMHAAMGRNWLGCGKMTGMPMIMPMMMGMMGSYYPAYFAGYDTILIFGILGWILFILLVVFVITRFSGEKPDEKKRR